MDLLIAILMMMGVSATPDSFTNKEFLDKNAAQVKEAQLKMDNMTPDERKAAGDEKSIIVTTSTGNG